jgi:hypothetical protein
MTTLINVTKYGKGREIETVCQDNKILLRAFIGKGSKEVCYKTQDLDLHKFAIKLGWEKP